MTEKQIPSNETQPAPHEETETTPKKESFFKEVLKFSLIALLIVLPVRFFIAQPFIVAGASMDPAFASGQYLIVDQLSYRFEDPARGEIIIFRPPQDHSTFFIKRIIGLPEETVTIENKTVTITNDAYPNGLILDESYLDPSNVQSDFFSIQLEENEYFVLGDNRRASSDSRTWGVLDRDLIIGKALLRLFPVGKIGLLPGNHNY